MIAGDSPQSAQRGALALMLGYGFVSGVPLTLCTFTLQQWFATAGVSVQAIGLLAFVGLPYTLKFLWSPVFDRAPPAMVRGFGRRRGWLLLVQPMLAVACCGVALTDPRRHAVLTALLALLLAFLSASQDVLIDAWRIGTFAERRQGAALAAYLWGYRGAMVVAESGVIWVSVRLGWHVPLLGMAAALAAGMVLTLAAAEPDAAPEILTAGGLWARAEQAVWHPLRDFLARDGAWEVLAFVILFQLGKVFADLQAAPFYRYALGFSSNDVAAANFLPRIVGLLGGALCGAWLVARLGTGRAVLLTGGAQAAALALYVALLAVPTEAMLWTKVGFEFFAASAANAAFLTYLSTLCARAYTATQYALLSSVAALAFHTVGGLSGFAAHAMGWGGFYTATVLASLPALLIMLHLHRRPPANVITPMPA
jgi:PAT family beta-lactamase induction signal transducer AmpG